MKHYLTAFYKSIYDFVWLSENRKSLKHAFGYFALFMSLVAIVLTVQLWIFVPKAAHEVRSAFEQHVPNFTVTGDNTGLHVTDLEQPYIQRVGEGEEKFLVVVDTVTTDTLKLEEFIEPQDVGGILVARTNFQFIDRESNQSQTQSWGELENFSITRDTVVGWLGTWTGPLLYGILVLVALFVTIFWMLGKLTYIVVFSLVGLLISALMRKNWTYREVFTVGLYAVTLPTILTYIFGLFEYHLPLAYTVVFLTLVIGAVVTSKTLQSETSSTPDDNPPEVK